MALAAHPFSPDQTQTDASEKISTKKLSLINDWINSLLNNPKGATQTDERLINDIVKFISDPTIDIRESLDPYTEEYETSIPGQMLYILRPESNPDLLKHVSALINKSYSRHRNTTVEEIDESKLRPAITRRQQVDNMLLLIKDQAFYKNPNSIKCVLGIGIPNSRFLNNSKLEVDYFMKSDSEETVTQIISRENNQAVVASLGPLAIESPGSLLSDAEVLKAVVELFSKTDEILRDAEITHVTMIGRSGLIELLKVFGFNFKKLENFHLDYNGKTPDGINVSDIFNAYSNYWEKGGGPSLYVASVESLSNALAAFKKPEQ